MSEQFTIAIVDDERDMRDSISQWLGLSGYRTRTFATADAALKDVDADFPGIVITDVKMPGTDGVTFLKRLQNIDTQLPVILITGHGDVAMAVEAMQVGAYDFLEKPFDPDRIAEVSRRAIQTRKLTLENRVLRRELSDGTVLLQKLVGSSATMKRLREEILDASQAVRARRRAAEQNTDADEASVLRATQRRDARDSSRRISPLVAAGDAVVLDTSELSLDESVQLAEAIIRDRLTELVPRVTTDGQE